MLMAADVQEHTLATYAAVTTRATQRGLSRATVTTAFRRRLRGHKPNYHFLFHGLILSVCNSAIIWCFFIAFPQTEY